LEFVVRTREGSFKAAEARSTELGQLDAAQLGRRLAEARDPAGRQEPRPAQGAAAPAEERGNP